MARARILFAAVVLVLAVAACDSGDLPAPAGYATIVGVITDRATSKPIVGATVTVDTILTAVTDASGKFSVDKVPTGDYDYNVQAKGYTVSEGSGRAESGATATVDVQLDSTSG